MQSQDEICRTNIYFSAFQVRVRNHAKMVDCYLTTYHNQVGLLSGLLGPSRADVAREVAEHPERYRIYDAIAAAVTNVSRYDLPHPDVYRRFFAVNPLHEFPTLRSTCPLFRGCPVNRLDAAIAYDLPELLTAYKRKLVALQTGGEAGGGKAREGGRGGGGGKKK